MATSPFSNPFGTKTETPKDTTFVPSGKGKTADEIEDLLNVEDEPNDKPKNKVDDDEEDKEKDDTLESKIDDKDEEDDDEEEDKKDDIKLKDDEEDDEEKEKLDLKEDKEENLDVPPRKKDILAKYPKFFEEFKFFDKMMFRDKAYTEMFGSFDEAKEVFNKVGRLDEFESQLLSGNMKDVLATVKATNPKAFDKIVDGYLNQLAEVDKSAYDDVIQNFGKRIVAGMADEAKRKNNEKLNEAAKELYEFLFDEAPEKANLSIKVRSKVEKSEEAEKLEKERTEILNERFETARDGLTVKVDNVLKATINEHIDPRGVMSAYEKKNAINEALNRLHQKVAQDTNFRKNLDRLWRSAFGDKFSENSLNGIKKSYLGKARGLIASVIKDVRGEVLKDNRSKGKSEEKEEKETTLREPKKNVNAGRPHQQNNNKANERKPGETVEEFLSRD